MTTHTWVIGGRGLLGSAVTRAIGRRSGWQLSAGTPLPWGTARLDDVATTEALRLAHFVQAEDRIAVVWAAGAAVTSATPGMLRDELEELERVLTAISVALSSVDVPKCLFYASSAGGIYAGSSGPPFDETSPPAPISDYGRFKLEAEEVVWREAKRAKASAVVGRIANLYGPGQRLDKMQGLISHLALAQLRPTPASIFVPLDTLRDYIYVDDCAELVLDTVATAFAKATDGIDQDVSASGGTVSVIKVMGTGHAASIAELLGHFARLSHGHPHVMVGSSPLSALQARDLRLRSRVWPELDRRMLTPLPVGIKATIDDMLAIVQQSSLPGRDDDGGQQDRQ